MLSFVTDAYKTVRRMNFLQLGLQCLNFVSVVTTAFMMWKALSVVTNNESPIVVVLSESMSPAFERGDILFLTMHSDPLKVGDICVFNIKGREIPIVHRIHKVHETTSGGAFKILTKGDNNEVHDRGLYNRGQKWLENGDVVGRVKGNTPYLGLITIIMNDFPQVKFLILAILGLAYILFMTSISVFDKEFSGLELGLSEYKNRKIDWNAYEENKLIGTDFKNVLQAFENHSDLAPRDGYIIFGVLKEIKDFVARIKILLYAERYIKVEENFQYWKSYGLPSMDLLLIDCVNLNLETYQKCKILLALSDHGVIEATASLLYFLKHCCSGQDKDELLLGSLWLQFFLETPRNRVNFVKEKIDFVTLLVSQLKNAKSNQIQYQLLFCFWLLTFDTNNCNTLLQLQDFVPNLMEVAKLAIKEKVVRLVISCLANMLKFAKQQAIPQFVGSKVSSFVTTLQSRTYSDQEFLVDINSLAEELGAEIQKLSTFDEYASEIKSGQLEWSPTHKSELFWLDNATKLEENDCEILRGLSKILSESDDPIKLAIACHDVGQYIDHVSLGKKVIERLGIKQSIMRLISHDDSEVRYFALNAVQKYMSNLWSTI